MTLRVLDPTLSAEAGSLQLAPALKSLDGTVIGLLDNAKVGTGRFFDFMAEILMREYGVREFIRRRKPDTTRPVPKDMLLSMSGADAIVSAVGD
ncbi:MAG: hypothetical protein K8S22_19605 [Betaproteobacteria bacterium]|nr:hypothetical protein [Betaproteobacteria bacterium]